MNIIIYIVQMGLSYHKCWYKHLLMFYYNYRKIVWNNKGSDVESKDLWFRKSKKLNINDKWLKRGIKDGNDLYMIFYGENNVII